MNIFRATTLIGSRPNGFQVINAGFSHCVLLLLVAGLTLSLGFSRPSAASTTTLNVSNLNDSGPGSLRQAIIDAASGNTITFAVTGTLTLVSGELVVNKNLTLRGPGALNLSISGNLTTPALASRVFNNSAQLTLSGLTIRSGTAVAGPGGGVLNTGVLTITNSVFGDNRAQQGGGIYNSGVLYVTNSTFAANLTELFNAADASGAGIYNAATGVATITNSTFSSNLVHDNGSAFLNVGAATIANSTFSLNQQEGAAAIYNDKNGGALKLNNVTITLNTGKKDAPGLFVAGGSVTVANSLLSDNHTAGSSKSSLPDCGGAITSGGHNLIGNATGCNLSAGNGDQLGSNTAPLDAKLGPLQNNGGATSTHLPLAGSPAIDAGDPVTPGSGGNSCEALDQRGITRPVATRCDVGAVEVGGDLLSVSSSSPTTLGHATFFTATLPLNNVTAQWAFGDGATGSGNSINHVYAATGVYTVTVTVTSNSTTLTRKVAVSIVNPSPTITSISPASTVTGRGAFTATLYGIGFVPGSLVQWNNLPRPTTFISATELTVAIPVADVASPGTMLVTVRNLAPGGGISTPVSVTVATPFTPSYSVALPLIRR